MTEHTQPYMALALQITCDAVNRISEPALAREQMQATISRLGRQIRGSKGFIGPDTKLIVLPEYFLTGFPMGESLGEWSQKACIEMDGAEYAALGEDQF